MGWAGEKCDTGLFVELERERWKKVEEERA
jgi:hypothetical protein